MRRVLDHVPGTTFHGRWADGVANTFRYGVDYVLLDPADTGPLPRFFSRDRANLVSLRDRDHGGPPGEGRGLPWARDVLACHLPDFAPGRILLLAQPRVLGHTFNPVSFWLIHDGGDGLRAVIAEVTNTYGDRHSYLCHADDLAPIAPDMRITVQKVLHVSPFQPVEGRYTFRFDISDSRVGVWIDYRMPGGRLLATLTGPRRPLTDGALLRAALRRPFGSRRVLALIHWQALRLWWRGAPFRDRPDPPSSGVSR
ncbi:DUF1365 domain-containing protein [Jannaschia rubra]|uniref:Cyclopropane-fatty-acyl-phospholipid synthase n=1 Tax=Jannaschia rubra TaxID=282197 RepID=A0A0M6XTT4_9RHOB|nr:DUF1365 domain-containing protein [Jannaschia rubra]CTQ33595.1 hypothetical protein JAN5088_02377 [Jannaschia rubra]SFG04582.1 hypothetical protein SAMN04488517_102423 [Jannaschia rubra]